MGLVRSVCYAHWLNVDIILRVRYATVAIIIVCIGLAARRRGKEDVLKEEDDSCDIYYQQILILMSRLREKRFHDERGTKEEGSWKFFKILITMI